MKNKLNVASALAFMVLATVAHADTDTREYSPAYQKCLDKSGDTTQGIVECTDKEVKVQDARLNQHYKAAMQGLEGEARKTQLRDVQRAWVKYRDAHCQFMATLTGGTMDRIFGVDCMLGTTKQRADELEALTQP